MESLVPSGKMGPIRPTVKPLVTLYAMIYVILAAAVAGGIWYVSSMSRALNVTFLILPADGLLGIYFLFLVGEFWWIQYTQVYSVGDDDVSIQLGWLSKQVNRIPFHNMSDVDVVLPVVGRLFSLGNVLIETNDGRQHVMRLVKNPRAIATLISSHGQQEEEETKEVVQELADIKGELARPGSQGAAQK